MPASDRADVAERRLTALLYGLLRDELTHGALDGVIKEQLGPVEVPPDPRSPWDECGVSRGDVQQPDLEHLCRRLAAFILYGAG